jgi:hypothetical protein
VLHTGDAGILSLSCLWRNHFIVMDFIAFMDVRYWCQNGEWMGSMQPGNNGLRATAALPD